jgi:hypothetical protein
MPRSSRPSRSSSRESKPTSLAPKGSTSQAAADSSDSPVSDWEALYSSDDYSRQPTVPTHATKPISDERYPSEDEKLPDPWNAVCIVGFMAYSKDDNLELRIVTEGGDLHEGGMGEKGAGDIDDAVDNAGGERDERKLDPNADEEGFADYDTMMVKSASKKAAEDPIESEAQGQSEEDDGDDESESGSGGERRRIPVRSKRPTKRQGPGESKGDRGMESDTSSDGVPQYTPPESDKRLF